MLPVTLDTAGLRIALAGEGREAFGRLQALDRAGAQRICVFAPEPSPEVAKLAGLRLRCRWPSQEDLTEADVLFVGDLDPERAAGLYEAARAAKVLVNVEDQPASCSFHMPATVRRDALTIAVSTGGQAPGLASLIRRQLERRFGPEWAGRLAELSRHRSHWRQEGLALDQLAARTAAFVEQAGWLQDLPLEEDRHVSSSRHAADPGR